MNNISVENVIITNQHETTMQFGFYCYQLSCFYLESKNKNTCCNMERETIHNKLLISEPVKTATNPNQGWNDREREKYS